MAKRQEQQQRDEVPVTVRLPPDVHIEAKAAAERDERSLNLYIVRAIRAQLDRDRAERKGSR